MAKETIRELSARWEQLTFEEKKAINSARRSAAAALLRPMLRPGDRLRATKAEQCNASEASFTFAEWDAGWIVSKGGSLISPAMVYSVNRQPIAV